VFTRCSQFGEGETPEVVTFFARGEVMAACFVATFVTGTISRRCLRPSARGALHGDMASALFGTGKLKAVLGVGPIGRKFMKPTR